MAKKEEKATQDKLDILSNVMGIEKKESHDNKPKPTFKTGEVVVLLLITAIISLVMGGTLLYKVLEFDKIKKVDKELQEFIDNYNNITKNYNGDIDKEKLLDAAIEGMLSTLDDNSMYLDSKESKNFNIFLKGKYKGIGIQVYNREDDLVIYKVLENSPAFKAGLKADDIVIKLNGNDVKGLSSSSLVDKVSKIGDKSFKLTVLRDDEEMTFELKQANININSVTSKIFTIENKQIGYIGVSIFANNTYSQFKKQLNELETKKFDSLIIDLRSNSGGYLSTAEKMMSLFLDSSHVIYQIQKDEKITKHYSKGRVTKDYKIYILVNGQSASASEVMTSTLKEQCGAIVIGQKTFGKGTVQELQTLQNGDNYKLTTKNWLTSKGEFIDGKGIIPDIEIELHEKYYENPTDENDNQLQKALEESKK